MKEYIVEYKIKGDGYISVIAEDKNDAMEEIDCIFCGNSPKHKENSWIDQEDLFDIEWGIANAIDAKEV